MVNSMGANIIPLIMVMIGSVCVIYFAYNNIIRIRNKSLTIKERRKINRKKKAKKKYGKNYIKH